MGGDLFARSSAVGEPTLNTPRLSPADYERLKAISTERLQAYFPQTQLECLLEAPQKTDYGDIDFIVAYDGGVNFVDLAQHLGAKGVICHHPKFCSMAARRDAKDNEGCPTDSEIDMNERRPRTVIYKHVNQNNVRKLKPSSEVTAEEYAQIDVELVPPHLFAWRQFYSSYGDLGGMIGQVARALGFTVGQEGLWLRMKELDKAKFLSYVNVADKNGMLWLSSDAEPIKRFLGLDPARFARGFATLEEMYSWLSECRLLSMAPMQKRNISRDRQKEAKRSVFSRFFEDWLPAHQSANGTASSHGSLVAFNADGSFSDPAQKHDLDASRDKLCKEALDFFQKHAEYEAMHTALVNNIESSTAAHLLKPILQLHSGRQDRHLNEIVRAFKRWVVVSDNGEMSILNKPHADSESQLFRLLANDKLSLERWHYVSEWAKIHWEELRTLERQRVKAAQEGKVGGE